MSMRRAIWILITLTLFDCTKEEFNPGTEETCRIGRYVYGKSSGSDVSYEVTYVENSLNQVDIIFDQILFGETWATNSTYKHIYRNDSLLIKDFAQFREGATYLRAEFDERIQQIITTFPGSGGTYRYTFDYSKSDETTVTLEKIDGATATFDSRGVYSMDALDNVTKLVITRNPDLHGSDPDNFTNRTITYTYDIVRNPLKDLVLVHFMKPELPATTYFSVGNKLTEKYDDVTRTYAFEYGTDPMPNKMTTPEGVVEKYEYFNCTN